MSILETCKTPRRCRTSESQVPYSVSWRGGPFRHTRGKAIGVVHKEHDLPVTHILGSKSEDRGEYSQRLEIIDVLTPLPVGNLVGVETQRYTRDAAPRLNQPRRTNATSEPPMTKLVVNEQYAQSAPDRVLSSIGAYDELVPRILPKAKFQVWDVGEKGLEKYQHDSHGSCPSEFIALGGGC